MSLNTKSLLEAYCQRNKIQSHEEHLSRLLDLERKQAIQDCVAVANYHGERAMKDGDKETSYSWNSMAVVLESELQTNYNTQEPPNG